VNQQQAANTSHTATITSPTSTPGEAMPGQHTQPGRRVTPDEAGDGIIGHGPFDKDLHQTPKLLWTAVVLMCVGAAVVGLGVVALSTSESTGVILLIIGAVIGLVGIALAATNGIMSNVE